MIYCPLCKKEHIPFKTRRKLSKEEQVLLACLQYYDGKDVEVLESDRPVIDALIKRNFLIGEHFKDSFIVSIK